MNALIFLLVITIIVCVGAESQDKPHLQGRYLKSCMSNCRQSSLSRRQCRRICRVSCLVAPANPSFDVDFIPLCAKMNTLCYLWQQGRQGRYKKRESCMYNCRHPPPGSATSPLSRKKCREVCRVSVYVVQFLILPCAKMNIRIKCRAGRQTRTVQEG